MLKLNTGRPGSIDQLKPSGRSNKRTANPLMQTRRRSENLLYLELPDLHNPNQERPITRRRGQ